MPGISGAIAGVKTALGRFGRMLRPPVGSGTGREPTVGVQFGLFQINFTISHRCRAYRVFWRRRELANLYVMEYVNEGVAGAYPHITAVGA